MTSLQVQLDEEALIREQIAQVKMPEGVKLKRIEDSQEFSGEPAWRIYFTVSKSVPLTKKRLRQLSLMNREIFERIMPLESGRWPFFELIEVK